MGGQDRGYGALVARSRAPLYALTTAAALGEAAGLRAAGMVSTLPLAAQGSALLPVMAFHDGRWLFVFADSWPVLAGELVAAVGVRSCMAALCVKTAWPGRRCPAFVPLLGRAAVAYVVLLAVMSPWALLSVVTAVTSFAYPLVGGVAGVAILAIVVLPHAGVARWWWARWPPWRAMAWSLLDLVIVTAAAVGIAYSPGWVVLGPAAAAGLLNGWCWQHLVGACAPRRAEQPGRLRLAVVPGSFGVVAVGLVVLMATILTYVGRAFPITRHLHSQLPHRGQQAVLLVDGYQSRWSGGAPKERFPGFFTSQFSYAGLGPSGEPLPYASVATTQSLVTLARRLAGQVDALTRLTGEPVDVVAVSEGTYIVRDYLASHPHPPLRIVVLASPLPRPDRVFVPEVGRTGYGFAAAWEIHAILGIARAEDPTLDISVDMPMVRSLLAQGPLFRQRSLCPVPGVRVVALLPLSAAIADPPGPAGGIPTGVLPAVHATLVEAGAVKRDVARILAGHPFGRYVGWGLGYQLLRYAASAAEAPSLPLGSVTAWRRQHHATWGDAAFGTYGCPAHSHPSVHGSGAPARSARARAALEQTAVVGSVLSRRAPEGNPKR